MIKKHVTPSSDFHEAKVRFLDQVQRWIQACIHDYADAPPTDVHDQATYTTGWEPYLGADHDAATQASALAFMKQVRDDIGEHFTHKGMWKHGYWTMQEAHHGTEHFELFLGALLRLDPTDEVTQAQFLDAAEHIGNWVPEIPLWFDEETGQFRSMYMGTEGVRTAPGMELNIPDHVRFVNLCLIAHKVVSPSSTETSRYLALATRYATLWAEAILAHPTLPVGLLPSGPVYDLTGDSESAYRAFAGMAGHLDDNVDRTENMLASGAIQAFLTLWQYTHQAEFRRAAERLLDILATQLPDADAGAAADAIRFYRRRTGDHRYDKYVMDVMSTLNPFGFDALGLDPDVQRPARPHGIGKRTDMPNWYELKNDDAVPRRHNPVLMAVAAEIAADATPAMAGAPTGALAARALDLARTYFELACEALPDGRHHGCAANTVSAIARGHGRENHAGMLTAVLDPLLYSSFGGTGRRSE